MNRFNECLKFVLQREGGYVNHKNDRGGATNRGITQDTYDIWRVRNGMSRNPVLGISGEEVEFLYHSGYWRPVRADDLMAPLDLCLFDSAVQHGAGRAAKWLQRTVGVRQDGAIGPKTLTALALLIERDGLPAVIGYVMEIRDGFYHEIVADDPTQMVFLEGWMNRMDDLREALE
jgi:lysozyme family protein